MGTFFYYVLPTFAVLIAVRKWREYQWGYCSNNKKLKGKVVVITGANSGIGFETAKELAFREAKVILACRDLKKANEAIDKILMNVPSSKKSFVTLIPMHLDLASLSSVVQFVKEFNETHDKLDILINNAGLAYPSDVVKTTDDGFEIQFEVNHLSHFLLTNLLLPKLKKGAPSKVIVVSSKLHERGNIYLDDLNLKDRKNKSAQYENSKLANAYFARELAERVKSFGINVYMLCPGWVYTNLFQYYNFQWYKYLLVAPIAFLFMRNAKQGAQTVIHCATDESNDTGHFYRDCKKYKSAVNFDLEVQKKLWDKSEQMVKKYL